jgi:signal transduction histidine kinase
LLELINGVLDLSKVEAGAVDLDEDTFDPATIVREALETIQPAAEKSQQAYPTPSSAVFLIASPARLK